MKVVGVYQKLDYSNLNFFEHPVTLAYFELKECLIYYSSGYGDWQSEASGRNFYPQLIKVIRRFVRIANKPECQELLDDFIFKAIRELNCTNANSNNIQEIFKSVNEQGFKLLNIEAPINFDTLRQSYRKAAKIHHPDVGGRNEDMQIINNAFTEFSEILLFHDEDKNDNFSDYDNPKSTYDFCSLIISTLIIMYVDLWAVDKAYYWFKILEERGCIETHLMGVLERFSSRLYAANMREEAHNVYNYAYSEYLRYKKQGIDVERYINETKSIIEGNKKLRVILNHPFQAKNAFRLGIIDERRYFELRNKFTDKILKHNELDQFLTEYLRTSGFIKNLPSDIGIKKRDIREKLIPYPGIVNMYYPYIEELSQEQQNEYLIAFSTDTNPSLIKKYIYVRLNSYLKSIVYHHKDIDMESVIEECKLLDKLVISKRTRFSSHCRSIIKFIEFIRTLTDLEREQRLSLIREIHELTLPFRNQPLGFDTAIIQFALSNNRMARNILDRIDSVSVIKCMIGPVSYFTEDAQLPLSVLKQKLDAIKMIIEQHENKSHVGNVSIE